MLRVGVGALQQTHFLPEPSGFATSMYAVDQKADSREWFEKARSVKLR
jgi:hypothetical protein